MTEEAKRKEEAGVGIALENDLIALGYSSTPSADNT